VILHSVQCICIALDRQKAQTVLFRMVGGWYCYQTERDPEEITGVENTGQENDELDYKLN